uniref:GRIP domain-containing protein n=1 Tax=Panagrellus redivivus TaxID=6233 RepID=A0A7E4UVL2_PANRE
MADNPSEEPVSASNHEEVPVEVKPAPAPMAAAPNAAPSSKLDSLPREDLIRLLKKQMLNVKEVRKQADEYKSKVVALEAQIAAAGNDASAEMVALELSDYKNSCAELKKQLASQQQAQVAKDELVKELTDRSDKLMFEKAELENELKDAKGGVARLQKEIDEQKALLNEHSKEAQSLSLQTQSIRAEHDLEIAKLNSQLKRLREESTEQSKYVTDKTVEIRRLKQEFDVIQRRYEDLQQEHATFKERAEFVLKQKSDSKSESADRNNVESVMQPEIAELIKTVQTRNDKINQLTERCSFLEDELRSTQDHAKNLKFELEDAQSTLNSLRSRGQEERRRTESDYDFRLRQVTTEKDMLQKTLSRTIEQHSLEKDKLVESFQRQNSDLEASNRDLLDQVNDLRAKLTQLHSNQASSATNLSNNVTPSRVQSRVQAQIARLPAPINFAHTGRSSLERESSFQNPPGLDHDHTDNDDDRSLQDVIAEAASENYGTTLEDHFARSIGASGSLAGGDDWYPTPEDYNALAKQLDHTRDLLNDMEDTNAKLIEQIKILKEEIRRMERNTERQEHAKNSEYLKNVVMKFLAPPKVNDERKQLLPVLTTMLRLSPEEVDAVTKCVQEGVASHDDANAAGWSSYIWSSVL